MPVDYPTDEETRVAAYYRWERGGRIHGHHLADWEQGYQLVFMAKNYDVLAHHPLNGPQKIQLWESNPRRCRYCGAVKLPAEKWKEAHALPELVGNKIIIAMDECTACNEVFSKLESDLGALLQLSRGLSQIAGKKKIPSFVAVGQKSRVDVQPGQFDIKQYAGDPLASYDQQTGVLKLAGDSQSLTPIAVYKCLVKMAIAIMPPSMLPDFSNTIVWLKDTNHSNWAADIGPAAKCSMLFQPGPMEPDHGYCILLRRKSDDADLPYVLFVLTMANQSFQIMVPCSPRDDHWVGKRLELPVYPSYYNLDYEFGEPQRSILNLSSPTKQRVELEGSMTGPPVALPPDAAAILGQ